MSYETLQKTLTPIKLPQYSCLMLERALVQSRRTAKELRKFGQTLGDWAKPVENGSIL